MKNNCILYFDNENWIWKSGPNKHKSGQKLTNSQYYLCSISPKSCCTIKVAITFYSYVADHSNIATAALLLLPAFTFGLVKHFNRIFFFIVPFFNLQRKCQKCKSSSFKKLCKLQISSSKKKILVHLYFYIYFAKFNRRVAPEVQKEKEVTSFLMSLQLSKKDNRAFTTSNPIFILTKKTLALQI